MMAGEVGRADGEATEIVEGESSDLEGMKRVASE